MLDNTTDGGQIVKISAGTEKRVYATLTVGVDSLDLTGLSWEPRHKTRKGGVDDAV